MERFKTKRVIILIVAAIFLFSGGVGVGKLAWSGEKGDSGAIENSEYSYLARRIFIDNPNDSFVNFNELRNDLRQYFAENNLEGSIYFEYLPTGTSIRIEGDDEEVAASLMKLPAAMDLYKAAELGKIDLDQKVSLKQEWLDGAYGELYKKGAGYEISLREATKVMLQDSDNTALKAIAASTADAIDLSVRSFNALDVSFSQNADLTVSISARSYSSFLKCLYFSCYLSNENSQELLEYLTKSTFNNRLVAGISDKNIKVAHKIGVYSQTTQSDCGIVYIPKRNYTLCVMLRGADNPTTDKYISTISQKAYTFLSTK